MDGCRNKHTRYGNITVLTALTNPYDMDAALLADANAIQAQALQLLQQQVQAEATALSKPKRMATIINGVVTSTGWITNADGSQMYITQKLDAAGNVTFSPAQGIMDIDGVKYGFSGYGLLLVGLQEIQGKLYYLEEGTGNERGRVHTGFVVVNGVNYYCDPNNGGVATPA